MDAINKTKGRGKTVRVHIIIKKKSVEKNSSGSFFFNFFIYYFHRLPRFQVDDGNKIRTAKRAIERNLTSVKLHFPFFFVSYREYFLVVQMRARFFNKKKKKRLSRASRTTVNRKNDYERIYYTAFIIYIRKKTSIFLYRHRFKYIPVGNYYP